MEVRKKEIEELQSQAQALSQEGKSTDEVDSKRLTVQTKFMELLEPLNERKQNLLASKEIHQFNRDVEDEIVSASSRGRPAARVPTAVPDPPQSLGAELSRSCTVCPHRIHLRVSVWFSKDKLRALMPQDNHFNNKE